MKISIDFGITTTDVVTDINNKLSHYMMPSDVKILSIQSIKNIKKKIKNHDKIQKKTPLARLTEHTTCMTQACPLFVSNFLRNCYG